MEMLDYLQAGSSGFTANLSSMRLTGDQHTRCVPLFPVFMQL